MAAWAGLVVLLALHLDAWRPQRAVVYAGWIPEELLYRLAWMAGAFVYLLWFCAAVWRDGDGRHGRHDSHGRHGGRTR